MMNNRKHYSIEYPLKIIEINDFKKNPVYILEQVGLYLPDINKFNVLMFIDSYDYKKYFNGMPIEFLMLNRLINVDNYETANKLYKLFLNSKVWLIHGFVENGTSFYKSDNDEGNFLLILNTTDLFVKNQILDGLKRLLDSFLTNKKFLFEIQFDEILKSCLKRKMEIQYLHKTTTSKFKCIKSNILFTTLNLYSPDADFIMERQNSSNSNETKLGSFMKRFRNAFSAKTQSSNIISSKFSLNQLPYLSFQHENRNTFTFSVNNEDKFFKIYKNSNIVYQRYIMQDNSRNLNLLNPSPQQFKFQSSQKAYSESSLLTTETPSPLINQKIYMNDLNQNYYYNEFDQLEVDDETVNQQATNNNNVASNAIYYNTQNEIETEIESNPTAPVDVQANNNTEKSSSSSSLHSTNNTFASTSRILLQKAKSVDQISLRRKPTEIRTFTYSAETNKPEEPNKPSSPERTFTYFENKPEEHIYEDDNLIISEDDDTASKSIQHSSVQPSKSCSFGSIRQLNIRREISSKPQKKPTIYQQQQRQNSYFSFTPPQRKESYLITPTPVIRTTISMKSLNNTNTRHSYRRAQLLQQKQQQRSIYRL